MSNVEIILAGPGTGKTYKVVNDFISKHKDLDKILVLSFTNATIKDLLDSFTDKGVDINERNCMTLYKYALKINHLKNVHILSDLEEYSLQFYAKKLGIDFDDLCDFLRCITFRRMITSCISFIKTNPSYIKDIVGNLELLIVDEYQDFNKDERDLLDLIFPLADEVLILGDDDQSIYGFKNADPEGIINLYKDKNTTKLNHENKCYRCPKDVVEALNNLISNNKLRIQKKMTPDKNQRGIKLIQKMDLADRDKFILNEVVNIQKSNPDTSIMIISPVGFAVDSLVELFDKTGVGYVNWFIKKTNQEKMLDIWKLRAIFAQDKLKDILFLATEYIRKHSTKKKKDFIKQLSESIKSGKEDTDTINALLGTKVIDDDTSDNINKEPDLDTFFKKYPDLIEYRKHLEIESEREKNLDQMERKINEPPEFEKGKVNIMSIHKSKGLQADYVFLVGLVNGILPNKARGTDSTEAQRRELYVAISRTSKYIYLISTVEWEGSKVHRVDKKAFKYNYKKKVWQGQTSLFINELKIK